ncbi:MAG TPA: hypothetical protein VF510_25085 [Ktedonobacterales bacterium]
MAWNRRWLRTGIAAMLVAMLMAVGIGVSNARADTGNGATVLHDNPQCFVEGAFTICLASKGVVNSTTTPSGNESDVYNVVQSVTVYYGATLIVTDTFTVRYHGLGQNDTVHEQSDHECEVYTFLGTTYTFSYDSHIVNGQIQYQSNGSQC